jgi:DNA/RNA endonuclease YhcR with UshA esterase domain
VSYKAGIKEEELKSQVDRSLGFLGDIGSEVTATVKVSRVVWSNNYGTFYVSGMTTTNQLVFFNYKNRLTTGNIYSIRGRVKNHRDDTTQINRVKILDK